MRPPCLKKSRLTAVLGLSLAGMLVLAAPARAEDDVAFDTKILRGIMSSLGLQSSDKADINYEERPPLVLPSDHRLPPPQSDAAVKNPAWPKDPDVARAKMLKEFERDAYSSDKIEHDSHPLRPDELTPGKKYAPRTRRPSAADPASGRDEKMTPSELGYTGGLFGLKSLFGGDEKEEGSFTGEPPRTSLTEPPRGYQTPSPDQPYGVGGAKIDAENSYVTRGENKEAK